MFSFHNYNVQLDGDNITLQKNLETLRGVLTHNPGYYDLTTTEGLDAQGRGTGPNGREQWGQIPVDKVWKYYKIASGFFAGGRFVIFHDGHSELTQFGSGRPVLNTMSGVLQKI